MVATALQLRPYQERAVEQVLAQIRERPVLTIPTGGGKTVIAAEILRQHGGRVLWVAHRRELIHQAAHAIERAGLRTGLILPGHEPTPGAPVQVASIQTLARRGLPPADLVVVDEAHHCVPGSQYASLFVHYAHVLGLTATPYRLDGRGLRDVGFRTIVVGATVAELVAGGWLVEPRVYAPALGPDLSEVRTVAGDYNQRDAGQAMSMSEIVGGIVDHWRRLASGQRTVLFAATIEQSLLQCGRFTAAGIAAEHLDGTTPPGEREAMLARLREGRTLVLCNVGVLTEGWDLPSLSAAVIARPTQSRCLHRQILGRIMRAAEGKSGALVLDHAGNTGRHGFVTDPEECTLDGLEVAGDPDLKTCPECELVVDRGTNPCPACGYEWASGLGGSRVIREVAGSLTPVAAPRFDESRSDYYSRVWWAERRRGRSEDVCAAVASRAFHDRFGAYPLAAIGPRLIDPSQPVTEEDWARLREGWATFGRRLAVRKAKDDTFVAWLVRKREVELRLAIQQAQVRA